MGLPHSNKDRKMPPALTVSADSHPVALFRGTHFQGAVSRTGDCDEHSDYLLDKVIQICSKVNSNWAAPTVVSEAQSCVVM